MILQNLLQPDKQICSDESMFYHVSDGTYFFDTYFNAFSLEKWKTYTTVKNIRLHLSCASAVHIEVHDEYGILSSVDIGMPQAESVDIPMEYGKTSRFIYFAVRNIDDSSVMPIKSGYFYTKDAPEQEVSLALDICTYKREEFVYHNIGVLKDAILTNPESPLHGKIHIFISDNGQSLDAAKLEDEHIHVYPNMNAGGTGGFARGVLEIQKKKEELHLTHMIFMDDDIVLNPDALVRTYGILSYARDSYKRSSIAGAMLRLDRRYTLHEVAANWAGGDPIVTNQGMDLRTFAHVMKNEELRQGDYAAWWYACYPLSVVSEDNMPIPFFLHMDDVEYGLRNRNGVMTLNGINVWHSVFENKRASSLSYYDIRNIMLTNAVYFQDGNLRFMKKYIFKRFMANTLRFRYKDVNMTYMAVRDFCKGPEYLKNLNPQEKNRELMDDGYKMLQIDDLTTDDGLKNEIKNYRKPENISDVYQKYIVKNKWKYQISVNGWLLPSQRDKVYAYPMGIHPYALFRKKNVILFDPDSQTGIAVHKSWRELMGVLCTIGRTYLLIATQYRKAQQEYRREIQTMQTAGFWRKYLKLDA